MTPKCPPHHWLIEPPKGVQSLGACRICGEQRKFINSWGPDVFYKNASSPNANESKGGHVTETPT